MKYIKLNLMMRFAPVMAGAILGILISAYAVTASAGVDTAIGSDVKSKELRAITIESWETQYPILSATTIVSFTYVLKSGRTGEELWRGSATMSESSEEDVKENSEQSSEYSWLNNLIEQAISAAIQRAAPDYMPLVRQANSQALRAQGQGFPAGPYSEEFGKD